MPSVSFASKLVFVSNITDTAKYAVSFKVRCLPHILHILSLTVDILVLLPTFIKICFFD